MVQLSSLVSITSAFYLRKDRYPDAITSIPWQYWSGVCFFGLVAWVGGEGGWKRKRESTVMNKVEWTPSSA